MSASGCLGTCVFVYLRRRCVNAPFRVCVAARCACVHVRMCICWHDCMIASKHGFICACSFVSKHPKAHAHVCLSAWQAVKAILPISAYECSMRVRRWGYYAYVNACKNACVHSCMFAWLLTRLFASTLTCTFCKQPHICAQHRLCAYSTRTRVYGARTPTYIHLLVHALTLTLALAHAI